MFDPVQIKKDFPIFKRLINGKPIVYLDSTASSLKPQKVLDAINEYYTKYSVNIFRGVYKLSEEATAKYEQARAKIAKFIGASNPAEVVFTRSATEAINLVVYSWGRENIGRGSEIVSTLMEHHANFVPWQQLALSVGAFIKYIDFDENGQLDTSQLLKTISSKTKIVTLAFVSNVLGTINPIGDIIRQIKRKNPKVKILIDAAAAVPHMKLDVNKLGCDFLAFSGHKMLGPTGIGALWGKSGLLENMPPFNYGGEMIKQVSIEKTTFKVAPHKFEAGTPHIAGAIGLGAAVEYLDNLGMDKVRRHEIELTKYALSRLSNLSNLKIYGPKSADDRSGIISFNLDNVHSHDVAQVLDSDNICIRSGHHCAMPLHKRLNIAASARASFYIYNSKEDVDKLVGGLMKVAKIFKI